MIEEHTMPTDTNDLTLLDLLGRAEADEQPALLAPGRSPLNYRQLRESITALAEQLNGFGLGRGDRVAIVMPNGPELIQTFFAAATCATAAPLNPKYKQDEFAFYYADTQAQALITLPGDAELAHAAATPEMLIIAARPQADGTLAFEALRGARAARSVEQAQPDDVAMILHTSGTTSRPKRVPIRHRNMAASARNIVGTYSLTAGDVALCIMPLFHIHGIVASMLSTLASGGTLICPDGFNALEFWQWIDTYRPTWYSAVPTMHQMILARAERNAAIVQRHRLRFIRSSSAALPPVVLERMEATYNTPVLESYGMTEATHQMASNPPPPQPHKPGSVGYGFGVQVAIMDEAGSLLPQGSKGEVVVRGPNVIDGYENNPEANATAFVGGWFRTGDQGVIDADGYLALTGRLKELINRGGEKISPIEIDDVLLRHTAVAEALAFAVPHKTLGEDIHAALVLKEPATEPELRAHCAALLADFKVPRKFHILEQLPRGATGKPQRISMAKQLGIVGD
jgi:acyl-CoA synthetase (AMP-forming)/AMP-acid ligase II